MDSGNDKTLLSVFSPRGWSSILDVQAYKRKFGTEHFSGFESVHRISLLKAFRLDYADLSFLYNQSRRHLNREYVKNSFFISKVFGNRLLDLLYNQESWGLENCCERCGRDLNVLNRSAYYLCYKCEDDMENDHSHRNNPYRHFFSS